LRCFLILITNIIFLWRILFIFSLFFIIIRKIFFISINLLINYIIFQEFLGFIFLLNITHWIQLIVIFIKRGTAPLHFWMFFIINYLKRFLIIWIFLINKLIYYCIYLYIICNWVYLLLLGILFVYIQIIKHTHFKILFMYSSLESFNWILIGLIFSIIRFLIFYIFYLMTYLIIINLFFSNFFYLFDTIFIFIALPFRFRFILKIIFIYFIFTFSTYIIWILCLIFLYLYSMIYLLYNYIIKNIFFIFNYNYVYTYVIIYFTFIIFIIKIV
jgi:hypothetical protein